jgi:hypothetical protein
VIQAHSDELLRLTEFDPTLPFEEQLRASLDLYLDYIERNPATYRALHRSMVSTDEQICSIVDKGLTGHAGNVLSSLGIADNPVARLAVRSWMAFMVAACLDWQENGAVSREQVRDLCVNTLLHAVKS